MRRHHDNLIFGPGILGDDVAHLQLPSRRRCSEYILLYRVSLEPGFDVILLLLLSGRADPARTKTDNLFEVPEGPFSVDSWRRSIRCTHGHRQDCRLRRRSDLMAARSAAGA